MKITDLGQGNTVRVPDSLGGTILIKGDNNRIYIDAPSQKSSMRIRVTGSRNLIEIQSPEVIDDLLVIIGSQREAHNAVFQVDRGLSIGQGCRVLLHNHGSKCSIGRDALFSTDITLRCSEHPHLVFDGTTGEYLDPTTGLVIGNHVWVGEGAYLNKRTSIPNDCIVAARAVVTKKFDEEKCVIGGNPGKVVRRDIVWFKNRSLLPVGSNFAAEYQRYVKNYPLE